MPPAQPEPPFIVVGTEVLASTGNLRLRRDTVAWPGGDQGVHTVLEAPSAAFIVPVFDDGTTILVRQWRHAWSLASWEVPAGTVESGESALQCAQRELAEEAGLAAALWTELGWVRGSALVGNRQHLFLARSLNPVPRAPESYERDMILRRLPLAEALEQALEGEIVHAAAVAALVRAARYLGSGLPPR